MNGGSESQRSKEAAVLIAVRNGFGLIRRGREVHKIYPMGISELVCSADPEMVWELAYVRLYARYGLRQTTPLEHEDFPPPIVKEAIKKKSEEKPVEGMKEVSRKKKPPKKEVREEAKGGGFEKWKKGREERGDIEGLTWREKRELFWKNKNK